MRPADGAGVTASVRNAHGPPHHHTPSRPGRTSTRPAAWLQATLLPSAPFARRSLWPRAARAPASAAARSAWRGVYRGKEKL